MRSFFTVVGAVVVVVGIIVGMQFLGLGLKQYIAPKSMALDNQIFKESAQYNDGMVRDLENLQLEYAAASGPQKATMKAIILHRFSVYPTDRLPPNLRSFYLELRSQQ